MSDPAPVTTLRGWGRTTSSSCRLLSADDPESVAAAVRAAGPGGLLARGAGRSYGDAAAISRGTVLTPIAPTAPINLDGTGRVRVSAGTSLRRLLAAVVPRGWLVPVLPGTAEVTVGGAVAADVHGKNHPAAGSFARHVTELALVDGTGELRRLTPAGEPAAFWATVGGMGLTGVIIEATLQLEPCPSPALLAATRRLADLDAVLQALDEGAEPYRVGWLDCLSSRLRGVVDLARPAPAQPGEASTAPHHRRIPLIAPPLPFSPLRGGSVRLFNEAWWAGAGRAERRGPRLADLARFHFPLDAVTGWNRLYGPRGFLQYQFLVPDSAVDLIRAVAERLRAAALAPFLAVVKRMGEADAAPLSFPGPGWSLAVDLPAGRPGLAGVLDVLDGRVAAAGGRVYLAKDARLRRDCFEVMYPRAGEFRAAREVLDPTGRFASDLGRRLGLC